MSRCGGLSGRSTAVAAAASGGETMAPRAMAGAHSSPGTIARATPATASVVRPTLTTTSAGDRAPVVSQIPQRRVVGGVQQHRRDEQRQREVGIDREHRHAGDERQHGATGGEEGGVRRADAPCQRSEQDGREQQRDENLEFMHGESKGESGSASSGSELRQPRACGCIAHFRGPPVLRDRVVAAAQLLEGNRVVVNE